jgi:hypothetical protein
MACGIRLQHHCLHAAIAYMLQLLTIHENAQVQHLGLGACGVSKPHITPRPPECPWS